MIRVALAISRWHSVALALAVASAACDDPAPSGPDDDSADTPAQSALARARQHLDNGEFRELVLAVKDVLENGLPNGPLAHEAEALLEQAYELTGGKIVPDFTVPATFGKLTIHFRELTRAEYIDSSGREWPFLFRPTIWIEGPSSLDIDQLTLVKHPDIVLVDRERGVGTFPAVAAADPVSPGPNTRVLAQIDPADGAGIELRGLYSLDITLADGTQLDAWFVVTQPAGNEHPTVLTPTEGEILDSTAPQFAFENFISSQFAAFEARTLVLNINATSSETDELGEPRPTMTVWRRIIKSPTQESTRLAQGDGSQMLADGRYRFVVTYGERRDFGGLRLSRDSALVVPFEVAQ